MEKEKIEISADLQIEDKVFKVIGYITNPNLSSIDVVINEVTENGNDVTRYYKMFDDNGKFQFALKEAYYKDKLQKGYQLLNESKKRLSEGIDAISEMQRYFMN